MINRELTPGETFTIARSDLLTETAPIEDDGEKSFWRYFQALAQEPSIEGVAFLRADYGRIYTTFLQEEVMML